MLSSTLPFLIMLVVAGTATAQDRGGDTASIRFVHAVPGAGEAEVTANGSEAGSAGFGEATDSASVPAGRTDLEVTLPEGAELAPGESLPEGASLAATKTLEARESYTAVALYGQTEGGIEVRFFRDGGARGGEARIRTIHAAPELGTPDMQIGDKPLGEAVEYSEATSYAPVRPGTYRWTATPQDGEEPVAKASAVSLTAGSTSTAVVVGTRGEPVDVVLLDDATAAPESAPATGLGGLAGEGGHAWPLILLAAALAGTLGGLSHRFARRASIARHG